MKIKTKRGVFEQHFEVEDWTPHVSKSLMNMEERGAYLAPSTSDGSSDNDDNNDNMNIDDNNKLSESI